jgi:hypothetical protein
MKLTEFKDDDICLARATIVNNKIHVHLMGETRGGATVEKALKSAILAHRERRSTWGYYPCYHVDLDDQGIRIFTVEG